MTEKKEKQGFFNRIKNHFKDQDPEEQLRIMNQERYIENLFNSLDLDHNGTIEFNEFLNGMIKLLNIKSPHEFIEDLEIIRNNASTAVQPDELSIYATTESVNASLGIKANLTYVDASLDNKVNNSELENYYTKSEVNTSLNEKQNNINYTCFGNNYFCFYCSGFCSFKGRFKRKRGVGGCRCHRGFENCLRTSKRGPANPFSCRF